MSSLDEVLLGFADRLRGRGVALPTDRVMMMVQAVGLVDVLDRASVAAATRATLCSCAEDVAIHDEVFEEYFTLFGRYAHQPPQVEMTSSSESEGGGGGAEPGPPQPVAHDLHRARSRPLRDLSAAERDHALRLLAAMRVDRPMRRARRRASGGRRLDPRATVRSMLRHGGEGVQLRRRDRVQRPRRVVVLVDVSGSMQSWAEANLRFGYALRHGQGAEVFTVATALTRVSAELSRRDVGAAVAEAGGRVPDWTGGTRLAGAVASLVDDWGRRGPLRGAVVVVMSDGLDTGDPAQFGRAMERLGLLAHRVVWVQPRAGVEGWQPGTRALQAALPHIDALVGGGSVAELELAAAAMVEGRRHA